MGKLKDIQKFFERKFCKGHDPDFLIIGTQKSGTTTLFYLLNKHPQLAGSWPKELHYFSRHQVHSLDWYRSRFTSLKRNPLFFEATPNYIYHESVAKKLKELYPAIKLIIVLRNPIDRAYSAWNMYLEHYASGKLRKRLPPTSPTQENLMYKQLAEGRTNFPSFHECIAMELAQMKTADYRGINFLRKGLYATQIQMYLNHFNKDQLLILGIKDLYDPQAVLNKVSAFLGVDRVKLTLRKQNLKKNNRGYSIKINEEDYDLLTDFYSEPNSQLKELLGYQVNW